MSNLIKSIVSKVDGSVNWIIPHRTSYLEARYVRRKPEYISAYLSSHNGCKMGCKFCWLTATKQQDFNHATQYDYNTQLIQILDHAKKIDKSDSKDVRVNINLMARGEPLANKVIINKYPEFYDSLNSIVKDYGYKETKINISTIMPYTIADRDLTDIFSDKPVNLYYSLYSINPSFREKWIPNAISWKLALSKLVNFQEKTNNPIAFHFALIENQNDNIDDIKKMTDEISKFEFSKTKFNIVRFNPHPSLNYKESSDEKIYEIYEILKSIALDNSINTNKTRIVPRADPIVRASCGMFITNNEYEDL
ncbi:ribosomal RNA large subunit methyltransferase RlmN/cfr [Fadolivirus algeromassiliense]|jgi:adenine C2-methylase RlmN of 23S rRNA A2503 and tRNA A37|uniref:Ribosomal RNA large subunit methyltransferase RlmN/cfr n=1 Tax=Fadolivirus FV1/VV64 TaxID=3070911 RepID=A0A7D3UTU6_9VIRU|nr:ribosomal RNA large subunit methyltransferase RlmN/cfr [Fadolivirus algeromassiliense]QKF94590.1 ribosomal RNA large subunit methyltransferase RlmN/cfr [Fadolivirus FV1/VV64]